MTINLIIVFNIIIKSICVTKIIHYNDANVVLPVVILLSGEMGALTKFQSQLSQKMLSHPNV